MSLFPRDWPLSRNLVPREGAFRWPRACCKMTTPHSPSDHCGHARGSSGLYMHRDVPELALRGWPRLAAAPVQGWGMSFPNGLLCLILCFLLSLDAPSVRSDLTLDRQGLLCHSYFGISFGFLCVLSWFPSSPLFPPHMPG